MVIFGTNMANFISAESTILFNMSFPRYLNRQSILFFFLMTRPPPSSTPFPYTPLFRSAAADVEEVGDRVAGGGVGRGGRAQQDEEHRRNERESTRIAPQLKTARPSDRLGDDAVAHA